MVKVHRKIMTFLTGVLFSSLSFADTTQSNPWGMFELLFNAGDEVWYIIESVLAVSGVAGIILIVMGLIKLKAHAMDTQGQSGHLKTAIAQILIGGLLFGTPILAMLVGNSLFGSFGIGAPVSDTYVFNQITTGVYNS